MPTGQRLKSRAPTDPVLDLIDAGVRVGYAAESLRLMMFREPDTAPPLYKVRGRWRVKLSELDAWATAQGLPLHPLP